MRVPARAVIVGTSISAALAFSACGPEPADPMTLSVTFLDANGRPVTGAYAALRALDGTASVATSDDSGRLRLELQARGAGMAEFASGPEVPHLRRQYAPLLLDGGEIEVVVRLTGSHAGVTYPESQPRSARWGLAVQRAMSIDAGQRPVQPLVFTAGDEAEDGRRIASVVDSLRSALHDEEDPEVRSALWYARLVAAHNGAPWQGMRAEAADSALAAMAPDAAVWGWAPHSVAELVAHAARIAEGALRDDSAPPAPGLDPETVAGREELASRRATAYLERIIDEHPDPRVSRGVLYGAMRQASARGRSAAAGALYDRLLSEFPGSREAELAAQSPPGEQLEEGDPAPDVSLPALDPASPDIGPSELAGPATLVDFWAAWCTPCVAEMPWIHDAHERFSGRGFDVVSVSFDGTPEDVHLFRRSYPMPWRHSFVGVRGLSGGEVAAAYGIDALPHAVLIGPTGRIIAGGGELRGERLAQTLERLLPSQAAP